MKPLPVEFVTNRIESRDSFRKGSLERTRADRSERLAGVDGFEGEWRVPATGYSTGRTGVEGVSQRGQDSSFAKDR